MEYIEPAWHQIDRKFNYCMYYVEKFFRDFMEDPEYKLRLYYYASRVVPDLVAKLAGHPIIQSVGADKTTLVASVVVYSAILTLVYILRKIVMGIVAGILIVILSPLLIVIYCTAKLIRCFYGPGGRKTPKTRTKKGKSPGEPPGGKHKHNPVGAVPPAVYGDGTISRLSSSSSDSNASNVSTGSVKLNALREQKTGYGSVVPPTRMTPASALRLTPTKYIPVTSRTNSEEDQLV